MSIDYIIIQAGGKGTRLEHLTRNKPKALVPVENLPMIFHLFHKYPDKRYIIIADYKRDVLRKYLESFAEVKYLIVDANGEGTCGGVRQAAALVPINTPFMLMWSDLILPDGFELPDTGDYIGVSQTFPCRWKFENGVFSEEHSIEFGVAGLFVFKDKSFVANIPQTGELVRHFSNSGVKFKPLGIGGTREFGTLTEYSKLSAVKNRPFNKMTIEGNTVIKEPVDIQGRKLAKCESAWYNFAKLRGITAIPKVCSIEPLTMECIKGKNIYECEPSAVTLIKIVDTLKDLHSIEQVTADYFSLKEAYFNKTMSRLSRIRDLVPLADRQIITINGRECRNVYFQKHKFEKLIEGIECNSFSFIHGDCTFSNIMLRDTGEPVLIDPRGYFGHTELFGDPVYDWAKLYYSIVGNYDRFNLKDFRLKIEENGVTLNIASNGWESFAGDFFRLTGVDERTIKLIHTVIWLSLTTYAWQDYDSICGAFYNGIYYLEELL